jgi:DNA adenine methylase
LPPHTTYVEPFAGGLSILLNKPPPALEVASDIKADLINFYTVLRDQGEEFTDRLRKISYTEVSFAGAKAAGHLPDPLEAAVRFLVRNRMSRGGLGKDFAWSSRLRGGQPGDVNAWETILRELPRIADRLRNVVFFCADALEVIDRYDSPGTLFYLDPPYPHGTRTARDVYDYEMSDRDHRRLLEVIQAASGMVMLSGYPGSLYDEALADWRRHEFLMPNHAGQGRTKERRIEVLWLNPACHAAGSA